MDGLTVAVPTRDRQAQALEAVEAIAPQLEPEDELIVVDNGSEDGTAEALTAFFADRLRAGRVAVEPEGGISVARNRALAEARREVVCFVDDDVRVEAGWLAALRRSWAGSGPKVACIGGPMRPDWGAPRPPWLADYLLYVISILDLGRERRRLDQTPGRGYVWGGNLSVRVAAAREAGGFDPERGIRPEAPSDRGEEEELQRRLVRAGHEVWYEPEAVTCHLIPAERLTENFFAAAFRARGRAEARDGPGRRVHGVSELARGIARYGALLVLRRPEAPSARFTCVYAWSLLTAGRARAPNPPASAL
jgi:glycosyltransferase involved in cell wall biosynthesis